MMKKLPQVYDGAFYSHHAEGSTKSAKVVLGLLFDQYTPSSVIDIGCGRGSWLAAAEALGTKTLKGIDGSWVEATELVSTQIDFTPVDLEHEIPALSQRYDLCISLEVAEHLPPEKAGAFIDMLCQASSVVLFSAAIRYQGGTNHLNEQWQSYWIDLFKERNYDCLDVIRPNIWTDDSVDYYYKQNTFLFLKNDQKQVDTEAMRELEKPIYDIAHPANYQRKAELYYRARNPSLRFCLNRLALLLKNLFTRTKVTD